MSVFSLLMPVKDLLKQNRNWLILAAIIFLAGIFISYPGTVLKDNTLPGIETQMEELEKFFDLILGNPPLITALIIFLKNFMAVSQMLFLGVLAGISPLATLFLNGYLLGFTLSVHQSLGNSVPEIILLGVLPHGIFELTAVFLCAALGLKLGYHCIASPLPEKTRLESFKYIWKEIISLLPLVVILLISAALIEIFVTPLLLDGFL